jgi:enoyl-CoA hydratase/carnithine racemase
VGASRAAELLLSSRVFLAEEALEMGLVHRVCPPEETLTAAQAYASQLVRTVAPSSLAETRRQIYTDLHRDVGAAVEESEELLRRMTTESDYREGVRAWVEKLEPRWRG